MTPTKQEENALVVDALPVEQALLFSALREEFNAKIGNLKAWGLSALIGGQVAAGMLAAYIGPLHAVAACARVCTAVVNAIS